MSQIDSSQIALFIGIDWADQKHDCCIVARDGSVQLQQLRHSPEDIDQWITDMLRLSGGEPIAIMLEQSRGPLMHALMFRQNVVLYPVDPKQLARYRESFPGGHGKSDPTDARYLARLLRERISTLRAWQPDDANTRLLSQLSRQRRIVVDSRTKLRQQLIAQLKSYFPLVLELFGKDSQLPLLLAMLKRWSDPRKLRGADRRLIRRVLSEHSIGNQLQQDALIERIRGAKLLCTDDALIVPAAITVGLLASQIRQCGATITEFDKQIAEQLKSHPDAALFTSLRGAGRTLAARLLCAFGSQPDRWSNADELASFSGIAPITRQSGKQRHVQRRYACPKYLRQTFHEFADSARKWCPWSKARYRQLRERGMKHHAAIRKLARSWIRILFRVWQTKTAFNEAQYIETLKRRNPEIIPYLEPSTEK